MAQEPLLFGKHFQLLELIQMLTPSSSSSYQKINSDNELLLKNFVNFVAIKNGMHSSKGYIYSDLSLINSNKININEIKKIIFDFFSKEYFAK